MRSLIELLTHTLLSILKLTTKDRWIFGMVAGFIAHARLHKIAIAIKPATILDSTTL